MKFFKLSLFIVLFFTSICVIGCESFFAKQVVVTFELNGGTVNSSGANQTREGVEGKYFKLPEVEYIISKTYDSVENKTNVHGKKFDGWLLKDTSTIIYNQYDTYGSFPEEDMTYVAKWGTECLLYSEDGDTTN